MKISPGRKETSWPLFLPLARRHAVPSPKGEVIAHAPIGTGWHPMKKRITTLKIAFHVAMKPVFVSSRF